MKKSVLVFSITLVLLLGGMNTLMAQEKPKPKKDTVNMDTHAKPTYYYAVEDEKNNAKKHSGKGSILTIAIVAGAVVIAGAAGFFFIRKKK